MNQSTYVSYAVAGQVAVLRLDRPKAGNALDASLRKQLAASLDVALADEAVRVILLASNGKVFSAGTDLKEAAAPDFFAQELLEEGYKPILMRIVESPKPVVCAIQGV